MRDRLAHAEPAEGQAVERQRGELGEVRAAQGEVGATLHDAEAQLVRREDRGAQRRGLARPAGAAGDGVEHGAGVGVARRAVIEDHADVGAERGLGAQHRLGGHAVARAVEVGLVADAVVVDLLQAAQAKHLEAAAVGQDRPIPGHHGVQPAELGDPRGARAMAEVVAVAEHDLGAGLAQVVGVEALHGAVGAHRHEGRGVDRAVGGPQATGAGRAAGVLREQLEGAWPLGQGRLLARQAGSRVLALELAHAGAGMPQRRGAAPAGSSGSGPSFAGHEHAVAVAVEAVAGAHGLAVGGQHAGAAAEAAHEHQQRAAREVEVGDEVVDDAEAVVRGDDEVDGAVVRRRARRRGGRRRPRGRGSPSCRWRRSGATIASGGEDARGRRRR
jgi:hypothetical protein